MSVRTPGRPPGVPLPGIALPGLGEYILHLESVCGGPGGRRKAPQQLEKGSPEKNKSRKTSQFIVKNKQLR